MSSIPAVLAAIQTRLVADEALAAVQVAYGHPYPEGVKLEAIWIGRSTLSDPFQNSNAGPGQTPAAIGQRSREERWALELTVTVRGHARHAQRSVTERAFEITEAVELNIASWANSTPTAFDGVCDGCYVTGVSHEHGLAVVDTPGSEGLARGCDVTILLGIRKRLNRSGA